MENKKRTVQFIGIKSTRTLLRYIERQIEKWIEREKRGVLLPQDTGFHIEIEREDTGGFYNCAIEVRLGSDEWRSYGSDRSLHDALKNALRDLKPTRDFAFAQRMSKERIETPIVA